MVLAMQRHAGRVRLLESLSLYLALYRARRILVICSIKIGRSERQFMEMTSNAWLPIAT